MPSREQGGEKVGARLEPGHERGGKQGCEEGGEQGREQGGEEGREQGGRVKLRVRGQARS